MKLYYIKRKVDIFKDKYFSDKILDIIGGIIFGLSWALIGFLIALYLYRIYG